jgi:hypothetical protein
MVCLYFFFQKYWHIVGSDVTVTVLSCLNSSHILKSSNFTHIVLIPKVKNPTRVSDYRPISLCNIIFKLISKVMANRMKRILPQIISDNQSVYVPGRLITDNFLVAFETLHSMHKRSGGRVGSITIKLDMSKAYDWVEWHFLWQIMEKLGFHGSWIDLVMACLSTVSYSVLLNGCLEGYIIPTRGIR